MEFTNQRFTVSEVASLTETNLNTVQSWRRKGFFDLGASEGWHRFTLSELFSVAVFAEVTGGTGNQDVASSACSFAVQMLAEIIESNAAPYFVGASRKGSDPVMEIAYGSLNVGATLGKLISEGADAGAYIVVDYSAIFSRLLKRLHAGGYAMENPNSNV
ncbi:hypothetical protein [Rhodovulum sp. MB263]|uniref:hypothetical protein n=1 Tax=Rhodovulum sp. (strain MB263) TaxID=308754 RepID=UPI0009B7DBBE|nr:hypothetical protein [Rhodovulum sp. MB263]ARC87903.1 hypothetical protein B5V46_04355 [Rhodovulum sp. MB263]